MAKQRRTDARFRTGFEVWLGRVRNRRRGRLRIGLLTHAAAVNRAGTSSVDLAAEAPGLELAAIFAPEHGYWGFGGAGESMADARHPRHGVPLVSLYGARRAPPAEALAPLDVLVIDLQDLGARCYTYVSTLRYALEAAAAVGTRVLVADRPVPLPAVVDGPILAPDTASFVGCVPVPLCYGMTPAETALWLRTALRLELDLEIAKMRGYRRDGARPAGGPPWVPPSPGIRTWEAAMAYTATVFTEALPSLGCDRTGPLPFQVLGAPWVDGPWFADRLNAEGLRGVRFHDHRFRFDGAPVPGVRLAIIDPRAFRPVATGAAMLAALQERYGADRLWAAPGARPAFFDKLAGTPALREALQAGRPAAAIAAGWQPALRRFRRTRRPALLYEGQAVGLKERLRPSAVVDRLPRRLVVRAGLW